MSKLDFWSIVNSTSKGVGVSRRKQVDKIAHILKRASLNDVAKFKRQLDTEIKSACTFEMMVAAFVVFSRLSDDLFLDFRSWVILHGRDNFRRVVANPDAIVELVKKKEVDRIDECGFFDLPGWIWLDKGGGVLVYSKEIGLVKERKIRTDWPANVTEFKKRYPVLFRAFWNAGRIKSFAT